MKTLERLRVIGRWRYSRPHRLEGGPHGDFEAVTHKDTRLDPSLERGNRAVSPRESLDEFDFSLGAREVCQGRDSCDDVAWRQADDEPVGVTENDRVIDRQAEC
jgi:hypothetical protein